jgi:hypothetical protein
MKKNVVVGIIAVVAVIIVVSIMMNRQKASQMQEIPFQEATTVVEPQTVTVSPQEQNAPAETTGEGPVVTESAPTMHEEPLMPPSSSEIQQALKNAGFYEEDVDGKIGPKTRQAIREFQEKNGLKVDGIVGPKTWGELRKYLAMPAPSQESPQ